MHVRYMFAHDVFDTPDTSWAGYGVGISSTSSSTYLINDTNLKKHKLSTLHTIIIAT